MRAVYAAYRTSRRYERDVQNSPTERFMVDRKWRKIREVLRGTGLRLSSLHVLVLGAGDGRDADGFRAFDDLPTSMVSLDLLVEDARESEAIRPGMAWVAASAAQIPVRDASFDLVYQSTLISSVITPWIRRAIYAEIQRVVRPGGIFLSYDMRYPNPWNLHTRPLRFGELRREFAGWRLRVWSLTGLPVMVRLLFPRWPRACRFLEAIPPLRSHLLAVLQRPSLGWSKHGLPEDGEPDARRGEVFDAVIDHA